MLPDLTPHAEGPESAAIFDKVNQCMSSSVDYQVSENVVLSSFCTTKLISTEAAKQAGNIMQRVGPNHSGQDRRSRDRVRDRRRSLHKDLSTNSNRISSVESWYENRESNGINHNPKARDCANPAQWDRAQAFRDQI